MINEFDSEDVSGKNLSSESTEYEQILETYPLTQQELEILELIVSGCSNGQIAEKLNITVPEVKTHVRCILNKLCADVRTLAAVRALRRGLNEDVSGENSSSEPTEYEQVLETYPLTQRELEILELIVTGCSNAQIAEKLIITVSEVKTHVRSILDKLCADDRTEAAAKAVRQGLID